MAEVKALADRLSLGLIKARRGFFKMSMREKALALLFALALLAVWFSWQLDRQKLLSSEHESAARIEREQEWELDDGPNVREVYLRQISEIDLETLPSKDEVYGQIDALVRRSGFQDFDLGQPRTQAGADLNFHTYQLGVQKATYQKVKDFTTLVKNELPYLSLERVMIQAQREDRFLDVRYVFKSIEYTK